MSEQSGRPSWASPRQSEATTAALPLPDETETPPSQPPQPEPQAQPRTAAEEGRTGPAATTPGPSTTTAAAQPEAERAARTGRGATTPDRQSRGQAESRTQTASAGNGEPPEPNGVLTRPKKPILAGAAITGAVLLVLPLLMLGSSDKSDNSAPAGVVVDETDGTGEADTVMGGSGDASSGGGAFMAASPTPTPTPTPTSSAKPSAATTTQAAKRRLAPIAPQPETSHAPNTKRALLDLTNILIKNASTGLCADVPGTGKGKSGASVQQARCTEGTGDNQMWSLIKGNSKTTGPGGTTLYVVKNLKDGLCLDVPGYGAVGATQVVSEYSCNLTTADNQLWWLDKRANNTYWIRNYTSNDLCLDVSGHSSRAAAPLTLWHCSDNDDQNWRFAS
ncbi:RICIN domain-containing protein [Streptomyces sp. NPDC001514]